MCATVCLYICVYVCVLVWLATQQLQSSIAFLPINPTLSPLCNQGRQKLATLNAEEFAQLVIDILLDTKRRQAISMETGKGGGAWREGEWGYEVDILMKF